MYLKCISQMVSSSLKLSFSGFVPRMLFRSLRWSTMVFLTHRPHNGPMAGVCIAFQPNESDYLHVIWSFRLYYVIRNWKIMILVMRNVITRKKKTCEFGNCLTSIVWTLALMPQEKITGHSADIWHTTDTVAKYSWKFVFLNPLDISCMYSTSTRSTTPFSYMD